MVAHVLGDKDDKTVSCGIAVAPVTDFRYYGQPIVIHLQLHTCSHLYSVVKCDISPLMIGVTQLPRYQCAGVKFFWGGDPVGSPLPHLRFEIPHL